MRHILLVAVVCLSLASQALTRAEFQAAATAAMATDLTTQDELMNYSVLNNPSFEKEIRANFAAAVKEPFLQPLITMPTTLKVQFEFPSGIYTLDFAKIESGILLFQNQPIKLEAHKTIVNYRSELQTILRSQQTSWISHFIPDARAQNNAQTGASLTNQVLNWFSPPVKWASDKYQGWKSNRAEAAKRQAIADASRIKEEKRAGPKWFGLAKPRSTVELDAFQDVNIGKPNPEFVADDILDFYAHWQKYNCRYFEKNCDKLAHAFRCEGSRLAQMGEWDSKSKAFTGRGWEVKAQPAPSKNFVVSCDGSEVFTTAGSPDFFVETQKPILDHPLCAPHFSGKGNSVRGQSLWRATGDVGGMARSFAACCAKTGCADEVQNGLKKQWAAQSASIQIRSGAVKSVK